MKDDAHISFERDNCQLIYPNGVVFGITERGCLYYFKNIVSKEMPLTTYTLGIKSWATLMN